MLFPKLQEVACGMLEEMIVQDSKPFLWKVEEMGLFLVMALSVG